MNPARSVPEDPLALARAAARRADAEVRRLVAVHEAEAGPPPVPFAWLALGSTGRREQPLPGEQDHALVLADAAGERDRRWFGALAARVEEGLAAAGYPPCAAGISASRLCRRLADWCARVRGALDQPTPGGVLEVAILLDGRRVAGRLALGPLRAALLAGADRPRFLRELARAALAFRPPSALGSLAGRRTLRRGVKRQALAPLVLLARCYGLSARCPSPATLVRFRAAREAGLLEADLAGAAALAFRLLLGLRMREERGREGSAGGPAALSRSEAAVLPALRTIRRLQGRAAHRFDLE